jgi:BNR/Asp-box repeat
MSPTVLAATWGDGLFVGAGESVRQELADQPVRGLAADGKGGAVAIVGGRSLRRRTAEGQWSTIATAESECSCCVAVRDAIYVGTDNAQVLRVGPNGIPEQLIGFDHVSDRSQWYAGAALIDGRLVGPPLGVRSMTATCDGAVLLANVHVGGIPRSTDHGATWSPTIEIDADVHQVCAHPTRPDLVIAAAAVGLCVSEDGGASWTIEQEGLHAAYCSAVAFVGDDMLVSASEGPFAARGAIYRRAIGGSGTLRPVGGGLPEWIEGRVDTGCMAAQASAVAVVDGGGRVYISDDAGRTWSCASERMPSASGLLLLSSSHGC